MRIKVGSPNTVAFFKGEHLGLGGQRLSPSKGKSLGSNVVVVSWVYPVHLDTWDL